MSEAKASASGTAGWSRASLARDYREAREAFLDAARDAGAKLESHPHPAAGPDGLPLAMDVARLGADDARAVLFLASGTHGVEGIACSAIQTRLLQGGLARRMPAGVAVVLVHAVNPYGFAWLRRVNEDNVDLNRNFLDHAAAAYPANALYDELHAALNPTSYSDADVLRCLGEIGAFIASHDTELVYRTLSGGQYHRPEGLQYGGREPAWSNRTLRAVWAAHVRDARAAVLVDLHTGLGETGHGGLMQTARGGGAAARLAGALWPDVMRFEPSEGESAALVSGLIGVAFAEAYREVASAGLVLEFGTWEMQRVMLATHADNWLHRHGDLESEQGRAIKRQMREAFLVEDGEWMEKLHARSAEVVDRALAGLGDPALLASLQ